MMSRSLTDFPVLTCAGDSLFPCSLQIDIIITIIIITAEFTAGRCHDDMELLSFFV